MAVRAKYLAGLAAKSQTELCEAEDALVEFIRTSSKRDSLYETTEQDLTEKYGALKAGR